MVARKVLGVGRSARLPVSLAAAGVQSVQNLYLQHCAELVDASLRASESAIRVRLNRWMERLYGVKEWNARQVDLQELRAELWEGRERHTMRTEPREK